MLGIFVVHPRRGKLGALIASRTFASVVAHLHRRVVSACLGSHFPRLGALRMTLHIFATLMMTVMHSLPRHWMMLPFTVVVMMVVVVIVMMPTVVAMEQVPHRWALLMAFMIARLASLMAGVDLEHFGALLLSCHHEVFRWELFAGLHKLHPRLWTFDMASRIASTPFMACMHFLQLELELVLPVSRKVMTVVEHFWALVMALNVAWLALTVARVSFLNNRALLLCHHRSSLGMLSKLLVHPVDLEFRACLALLTRTRRMALLDCRKIVACLSCLLHGFRAL